MKKAIQTTIVLALGFISMIAMMAINGENTLNILLAAITMFASAFAAIKLATRWNILPATPTASNKSNH